MLWIYLSGPMSSDMCSNTHRACYLWRRLQDRYRGRVVFICPQWSMLQDTVYPMPYEHWIQYDLDLLTALPPASGAVFRMHGESAGADREVAKAKELGIDVLETEKDLSAWVNERSPAGCGKSGCSGCQPVCDL